MWWSPAGIESRLDVVVEFLQGIGITLMSIDATLKEIEEILAEDGDGNA